MEPVRSVDTGVLYCDDNLARLRAFPDECVDLIYLDPPFFSNRSYEVIWGDEAEVRSFEDRWEGGIQVYVNWMRERMVELHRVLRATGSVYLHCDPNASHYLKVMCDSIFGANHFVGEIAWKRTGAHSAKKGYGPAHDTLLFYSKSADFFWEPIRGPYDPTYIESKFTMRDPDGRRYQAISLTPAGTRKGATGQPWRGIDPTARGYHWKYPPSHLDELDEEGKIYWPKKAGGVPRLKFYLDEAPGMLLQDVWTDIPPINARARERLGYPTQKPEALLERIIRSSSNKGDTVFDPFCGCGTTIAVAARLGREWIGIDISPTAVNLMVRRVVKNTNGAVKPRVVGAPVTVDDLRELKPFEFQNWVIQRLNGTHSPRKTGDMGIDGYSFMTRDPIQVKQSDRVGRNVVDNFETAIERAGRDRGYIIAFSFGRGAVEEAARAKAARKAEIKLVKVAELIEEAVPRPAVTPDLMQLFSTPEEDRPLPEPRGKDARPSPDELVESDLAAVG